MKLKRKLFDKLSSVAVRSAVHEDEEMSRMWALSHQVLPDLQNHYATVELSGEDLLRARLLICAQTIFMSRIIQKLKEAGENVETYVDIGDSDGSTRMLLSRSLGGNSLKSLGVNIQVQAVELIRKHGLEAECMDAMDLNKQNRRFDLVSVFETLEHLPDPIGFLRNMQDITDKRLIISVPLIHRSRVGLRYVTPKWIEGQTPTIANNHVFELCPEDLKKIFWHAGWRVDQEWRVKQFPKRGPLKLLMQYAWRKISFEGYYFVSLVKDNRYSSRFVIE